MPSAIFIPNFASFAGTMVLPSTRGPMNPNCGVVVSRGRLATDSIGNCLVSVTNAVVGSRYRIEVSSTGVMVVEGDVADADFTVNVPVYPSGNSANTLRLKIRKATSSPFYRPFETQITASLLGASAHILQQLDE